LLNQPPGGAAAWAVRRFPVCCVARAPALLTEISSRPTEVAVFMSTAMTAGIRRSRFRQSGRVLAAASATALLLVGTGCGRASNDTEVGGGNAGGSTSSAPASSSAAAAAGDFGTLKGICGPGDAKGATARGVTDSAITVGTMSDAGSTITPGLEIEFFQVGDAFVKWCNAAGGINGRQIKLNKHDAALFQAGAQTIQACRTDFMLVGNGSAFDQSTVKPRLGCKLGQIPSYAVSPDATDAGLQVQPSPNPANEYPVGPFNAMARLYPDAKAHFGIGGSNNASLRAVGLRLRDAVNSKGWQTVDYQEQPPLVDNWRPYAEEAKARGVKGFQQIQAQDLTPLITAANNVGWKLDFLIANAQFYDPKTIKAAGAAQFPTTYVYLNHWPFELADRNPAVKQAIDILHASDPNAAKTDFTALAFNAWTLWAQSATECGSNLTVDCVLQKAGAHKDWTSGGLFPARDTDPNNSHQTPCYTLMKVTPDGFVYDEKATQPNNDIFNCGPENVAKLSKTYQ
jgi:ABC-type branched-subunit amino acid transport system substrate-binding protein